MSLIAWLPLDGDVKNYGSNSAVFTNNNVLMSNVDRINESMIKYSRCMQFNGSNAYASADLPISQYMTFCLWVKFVGSGSYHVIDFRTASSAAVGLQPFYGGISYGLQVYSTAGGSKTYSAAQCGFTTNKWYHVAIIYTPTYCDLYINGVSLGKTNGTYTNANLGTQSFRLGTRASGANFFNGEMSDVRVYNHELSSEEINYVMNSNPKNIHKLIHFTFNEADFVLSNKMRSCGMITDEFTVSNVTRNDDTVIGDYSGQFASGYITKTFSSAKFTSTSVFSVSVWIKQTGTGTTGCLYCMRNGVGTGMAIFIISGTTVRFDTVNSSFSTTLANPYNTWHHICCVYDGSTRKIYIDGELKNSVATTSIGGISNTLSIGQSGTTGTPSGNAFPGRIADWRLYDIALTENQVKDLYNVKAKIYRNGVLHTNYFQDNVDSVILPDKKGNIKGISFIERNDDVEIYKKTGEIKEFEIEEE